MKDLAKTCVQSELVGTGFGDGDHARKKQKAIKLIEKVPDLQLFLLLIPLPPSGLLDLIMF